MLRATRWQWLGVILIGAMTLAHNDSAPAQDKKKHDTAVLNQTARDVINAGARLFNEQGDHAGCYRLYQGSLLTMRPFVPPDLQASIDKGLASAERMDTYADRSFELRRVLDEIRSKTKADGDDKKPDDKKKDEKKKKGKKDDDDDDDKGQVAGKLLLDGKPVAGGYFVTLNSSKGKAFSTAIQKDGTFKFKTPIPGGDYRIAIERIPGEDFKGVALPNRYATADTSPLVVRVRSGKQDLDLNLVK